MSKEMRGLRDVARVFWRYFVSFAVGASFAELAIVLGSGTATATAMFPVIVLASVFGGYGVIGFINRMIDVDINGWPKLPPRHCDCCKENVVELTAVKHDRDELRDALVALRLP